MKACRLRKVICCFRRRCWGMLYLYSYFNSIIHQIRDHDRVWSCEICLLLLLLWLSKTWWIWSSLYINALIILVSDTVTWTQSPSGGSPSVGLHPLLFGALTPPNWISWGLSAIARTGLCWQCCWCDPLSSGHPSTTCTHCCPRLHHDVCSYLQSWTGKNYLRGEHVGLKPV